MSRQQVNVSFVGQAAADLERLSRMAGLSRVDYIRRLVDQAASGAGSELAKDHEALAAERVIFPRFGGHL